MPALSSRPVKMGRGISRVVMIVRVVILCGLLLVLAAMAWQYVGARHGNKLVDEGNAAIAAATKLAIEAAGHYETLITDATIKDLAANRSEEHTSELQSHSF